MLWNFNTLEVLRVYIFGKKVEEAVISKDQTMVAIGGEDDSIDVIGFTSFTLIDARDRQTGMGKVRDLDFHYTNGWILVCGDKDEIRAYRVSDWVKIVEEDLDDDALSCEYAPDGTMMVSGEEYITTFKLTQFSGGTPWNTNKMQDFSSSTKYKFYSLRSRGDSTVGIAAGSESRAVEFNNPTNSRGAFFRTVTGNDLYGAGYTKDDSYFALVGKNGIIYMYNATNRVNTLAETHNTGSDSNLVSAQFSYDSNWFATGNEDGTVYLYARFCQGCTVGTYPNQTYCRQCSLDIIGCAICKNSTYCQACHLGYYLNSVNTCSSCDVLEGCSQCNSSAICTSCLTGFYKTGVSCFRCFSAMFGCLKC